MAGCMTMSAQHAAQGKYACIYEYDVKSADGNVDRGTTLLQIADAFAVFTDYSAFQLDSVARQPGASEAQRKEMEERVERNDHFFDQTVYQNDPSNRLTVHSVIAPYRYTYEEKINPIAWRLVDEEKEKSAATLARRPPGRTAAANGSRGTLRRWPSPSGLGRSSGCPAW